MPDEAVSISRPDVFSAAETLDERNPREVDAWLWCLIGEINAVYIATNTPHHICGGLLKVPFITMQNLEFMI